MHSKGSVAFLSVMAASVSAQWESASQGPPESSTPIGPASVYPTSSAPYGSSAPPDYYPTSSVPVYPVSSVPVYPVSSVPVYPASSYPQPYGSSSIAYPQSAYPQSEQPYGSSVPPPYPASVTPYGSSSIPVYPISTSSIPYPVQSSSWGAPVGPVSFSTSGTYAPQGTGSLTYSAAAAAVTKRADIKAREANAGVSQYSVSFIGLGLIMAAGALLAM